MDVIDKGDTEESRSASNGIAIIHTNYFRLITFVFAVIGFIASILGIYSFFAPTKTYAIEPYMATRTILDAENPSISLSVHEQQCSPNCYETIYKLKNTGTEVLNEENMRGDKRITVSFQGDVLTNYVQSTSQGVAGLTASNGKNITQLSFTSLDPGSEFVIRTVWRSSQNTSDVLFTASAVGSQNIIYRPGLIHKAVSAALFIFAIVLCLAIAGGVSRIIYLISPQNIQKLNFLYFVLFTVLFLITSGATMYGARKIFYSNQDEIIREFQVKYVKQ